jgi:hypothetical protein
VSPAEAMVVVLVTGVSGSGKSAIARQLTAMGRDAINMDADDQLAAWYDTTTGDRAPRPEMPDAAWLAGHEWRWDPEVQLSGVTVHHSDRCLRPSPFGPRMGESLQLQLPRDCSMSLGETAATAPPEAE